MPRTFTIALLAACAACGEGGEAPRRGESRLADEVQAPGHAPAGRVEEPGASGGRGDRHARGSGGRPTAISIEARSAPDRGAAPEGTPGAPANGRG